MAHPETEPTPGQNFGIQQGVGQGTIGRRRRPPRKEVQDVSISEASGLSLGVDGFPHPLETDPEGNLKVRVKDITTLMEEQNDLLRRMVFGLSMLLDFDLSC